jgi:transcription termination/antitermination protein NusA
VVVFSKNPKQKEEPVGSIFQVIEILSKEKGIDSQVVVDAVKDAMLVAARKQFKTTEDLVADFDPRGGIQIYGVRKVVEEVQDPIREISLQDAQKLDPGPRWTERSAFPKPTETLGRISAQTAKQVILQKVREAERETIHSEYSGRVGELVNCTVKRIEGQDLIVDLGKTEARLPKKEQSRLENFSVGDRVRCVIKSVEKAGKNAGVLVSRGAPELVMRLFEQEVPEIYDNTVVIKACAREAGERTKIAVSSRDRDVDSVGACVGMKGMRVQSIIRELRGEKIDIIEYSEDPVVFATHALESREDLARFDSRSARQAYGSDRRRYAVVARDRQERAERPPGGETARLEDRHQERRREAAGSGGAHGNAGRARGACFRLLDHGLSEQVLERLVESGVGTVEKLGSMTPEDLEAIPEIGPEWWARFKWQ